MKLLGALLLAFSLPALAAPDEEALGKSKGYPVCPLPKTVGAIPQECLVGSLSRYDQVAPTHRIPRGTRVRELKRADAEPQLVYSTPTGGGYDLGWFLRNNRNTGLIVMLGDRILVERYQYDRTPQDRFHSYSMAKTVVAMLVGIALHEKQIRSIDDVAQDYVPALKGQPYGATKLRHLLTMSSGIQFREDYDGNDDIAVLGRKTYYQQGPGGADTVSTFTTRAVPEGTRFYYSSADTQVLGLVLRAATGKTLSAYLSEKIWQPMGAEADATWTVDAGGYETAFSGIGAVLRDWARFGMLLAHDGALDGRQIIPAEWVRAATTPEAPHLQVGKATRFNGYGYQTWLIHPRERRFALMGVRGQAVFVDPATKLVIVHTAVHASQRDPASRAEQFYLFNGALQSLSRHMSNP